MWIPSTSIATRAATITPEDKSTSVMISAWVLMSVLVIMFLFRETTKFMVLRNFGVDDVLILLATICGVGLSITTLLLSSDGLGIDVILTARRANNIMKLYYAFDLLYVATLCFAKLSVLVFFYYVVVQRAQRQSVLGFAVFISLWTVTSLLAVGFQCKLPKPWEIFTLNCFNRGIFWIVYCIVDMTTDAGVIVLSVNLVAHLKISVSRKLVVVACFAPRLLVMAAALTRLIYLYPITPHNDPAFNLWLPAICALTQVCLSIATACVPYMKPFFEWMEVGACKADNMRRKGLTIFDFYACGSESAYVKGHKKGKQLCSMDSTVTMPLRSGRMPDVSPRIPSPPPLSPMTPPRFTTPPLTPPNATTNNAGGPSERRLKLHIPDEEVRVSKNVTTPHTASSHALSPECLSPSPLFTPARNTPRSRSISTPTRKPRSTLRTHSSSQPYATISVHGSPDLSMTAGSEVFSPPPQRLSLFPRPRPTPRYSLIPQTYPTPPPIIPRPSGRHRTSSQAQVHHIHSDTSQARDPLPQIQSRTNNRPRNSRRRTSPKLDVLPESLPPLPTATVPSYPTQPPPAPRSQGVSSPPVSSPPTLPTHNRAPPSRPPTITIPDLPSPQRMRNMRVLSPVNSSRIDQMSPISPPTPLTFWRDDSSPEGSTHGADVLLRGQRPWERDALPMPRDALPVLRDVRNSPKIVVQRPPGFF